MINPEENMPNYVLSSSSSQSDFTDDDDDENDYKTYDEPTNFDSLYHNKQVETLKHLRQILNENKILKRRLNLVESELEQYQDFKQLLPLKDLNNNTDRSSPEIDDSLLKTTDDKEAQTDFIEPLKEITQEKTIIPKETAVIIEEKIKPAEPINREPSNQFLKTNIVTELNPEIKESKSKKKSSKKLTIVESLNVEIEPKIIEEIIKFHKESQTENDILYVKQINDLKSEIELLKTEKENELTQINMANLDLKIEIENLKRQQEAAYKDYEAISDKFNEYRLNNMDTDHELILLQEKNHHLQFEIEQQQRLITQKDNQLLNKSNEIEILKENNQMLKESSKIIDEQQRQIEYLLAENEKHLKEKHIICQQKISELTNECNSYAEFIKTQNIEMKNQIDHINQLKLEIDKLKLDQQNFNFKEFVTLKRELQFLKQEKERKFANEVAAQQQPTSISNAVVLAQQPLPPIKESKKNLFKFFN